MAEDPRFVHYDEYARQRILQKLLDLRAQYTDLSFSAMANEISDWKHTTFHREYFKRLRQGTLRDPHVQTIVEWIATFHDEDFHDKLSPESIFAEVGISSRDYYFHLSERDDFEDWEEQMLDGLSGVYLCAPENDRNSYYPIGILREFFKKDQEFKKETLRHSVDIKQYIQERTILILCKTSNSYFHAAEFPMAALFPKSFETADIKMIYEGIGIASSNSIHVFLRECLSRVPKIHSILIRPKNKNQRGNPYGLSLYLAMGMERIRKDWTKMNPVFIEAMKEEYALSLEADHYMYGTTQISASPVPNLQNRIEMMFSRDMLYYPKPADFLRHPETHFIRPDLENTEQLERVIDNPLAAGELL